MNFLPIAILAYAFNGGSILIDKILIKHSLPKPVTYTFYVNALQLLAILIIPFGFTLSLDMSFAWAVFSGIISVLALFAFFTSLKLNDASLVGPIVGALNPLFSVVIGGVFLNQMLTGNQLIAVLVLVLGGFILTYNLKSGFKLGLPFWWMVASGLLFAVSYVTLRESFLHTSFINGLVVSRVAAGLSALILLISPQLRKDIFQSDSPKQTNTKTVVILLAIGQTLGAAQGILIDYAVSLASPALVNSLFGVQYLVILGFSLLVYHKYPNLLDEKLNPSTITQKLIGVVVLSSGLYLLAT